MVWGIWGKKGKNERDQDRAKTWKSCQKVQKNALFAPVVSFINKNKEERMRYDYENDENKQKRDNYGDRD